VLNNFFYGVQLMSGRVRVGDVIACEGVRGVVRRVSYQTTLVEEEDGSLIAFTNTNLFSKNFKNLTGGKNYEMLKIPVGVKYGTDIEKTRRVILEALKPLQKKDRFGRDIVDPKRGIDIRFDKFGDSSVDLIVFLYTTVDTHYTFPARAKELIYNALNENGIEIPFPQTDIYVKSWPENPEKELETPEQE
jgi:small-conductance mechanosensitive channel